MATLNSQRVNPMMSSPHMLPVVSAYVWWKPLASAPPSCGWQIPLRNGRLLSENPLEMGNCSLPCLNPIEYIIYMCIYMYIYILHISLSLFLCKCICVYIYIHIYIYLFTYAYYISHYQPIINQPFRYISWGLTRVPHEVGPSKTNIYSTAISWNIPAKYGLLWYSWYGTPILGSWNSHWSIFKSIYILPLIYLLLV